MQYYYPEINTESTSVSKILLLCQRSTPEERGFKGIETEATVCNNPWIAH